MINPTRISILLTKPVKKMPKGLIYNPKGTDYYYLFASKTGKHVGTMRAYPIFNDKSYYADKGVNDSIFYISSLEIEPRHQKKGWGEYFIDFAKKESVKQNCDNRISLVAYNFEESPHAFYFKQGFVTLDESTNKILNEYVKNHWRPYHWVAMEMYLPENATKRTYHNDTLEYPKKDSFLVKLLNKLFGLE